MTDWVDALAAARLVGAGGFGGVRLRGPGGPARDAWLAAAAAPLTAEPRRLPAGLEAGRLLDGADALASMAAGRAVMRAGLLAGGGVFVLPLAERLAADTAAALAAILDDGGVTLIALDEGEGDEAVPAALADRLGIWLDLRGVGRGDLIAHDNTSAQPDTADTGEAASASLVATAAALGVAGVRPVMLALAVARAAAARGAVGEGALALATRLVFAPRATRMPPAPAPEAETEPADDPTADDEKAPPPDGGAPDDGGAAGLADRLLEAARSALPPGLLTEREDGARMRSAGTSAGTGARRPGHARGRPLSPRPGPPGGGARLALLASLGVAAPWQALRRREQPAAASGRVLIRPADLRVQRREERARGVVLLVVDASGSAALERLAEAKGAALLLLADAYVRRDEVAVIAFRRDTAELLLPPTRSLARAKRRLAELAGGGGTPLAVGLDLALAVALAERARGRTPRLVLLSDGRANVPRAGGVSDRALATADATAAARSIRAAGIAAIVLDTAQRPAGHALALAQAMGARHAALPRVEAGAVRAIVGAFA